MDPNSTTAGPSFDIMGLPREVRDDIYEDVIFDLSPPDLFLRGPELDPAKFRNMNTNILLTNRKVYNEALDVIERRAQLVLVSATPLRPGVLRNGETPMGILTANSGITMIHPKYRNLCIMTHHSTYHHHPTHPTELLHTLLFPLMAQKLAKIMVAYTQM